MDDLLAIPWLGEAERRALGAAAAGDCACRVELPPPAGRAFLAWALSDLSGAPAVWVVDGPRTLDVLGQDLATLAGPRAARLAVFPAREAGRRTAAGGADPDLEGDRLDVLRSCREAPPAVVATCIQALLQPTLSPEALERARIRLRVGAEADRDAVAARLGEAGYAFEPEVQSKGVASLRGGLLDVWPPHAAHPMRIEFAGATVESIRTFDPYGQRSLERVAEAVLVPAAESVPGGAGATLADHLPPETLWAWVDPETVRAHAAIYERSGADAAGPPGPGFDGLLARIEARSGARRLTLRPPGEGAADLVLPLRPFEGLPSIAAARGGPLEPDALDRARAGMVQGLLGRAAQGRRVVFLLATGGARDRFVERWGGPTFPPAAEVRIGRLSEGFVAGADALVCVAESDLYGQRRQLRGRYELHGAGRASARTAGPRLADWTDIQPGEFVVHVDHGIGRYLGLHEIEVSGRRQEVLSVEYADQAQLHLPVAQAHLLSRYIGLGRRRPELHRLGGLRWSREKEAAERAVRDLAAQLLETQAQRQTLAGHAFPADTAWQHEFEAAFPYEETPDQLRAVEEVKADLERPRPMDRLICGDVGYGKTEVAMRAAFKAVMDGRQVAVLVPTTVLAQQHYDTFSERMAAFPVVIEMLSRFRTRAEQQEIVARLADGRVDVVIGTHRLVQPDIRFRDLGLVVIDEEQRFGVAHKEALKQLRRMVDVLTLTATPIPRTLYLSLMGARDMSVIQTPPRERLPVETIVCENDDAVVREAVLRELNREGQVFYLHNRVQSILAVRDRLARVVPEARVEVGHGRMNERELAEVMHRFVRGEFDVLLCTTIIESGVDIPNVNTILIDRADRFGVADLYQLRGRVGRFKHQAYAYLLLPRHGRLFDTARQRIGAIRKHSSLGAGFRLALRDLELRGAGNLLGAQQSGHIAAVGFDLYCQLLRRTVAALRGEAPPPVVEVRVALDFLDLAPSPAGGAAAAFPHEYVEDENQRLALYRRLAAAASEREVRALATELRDRFGPPPPPAGRLLMVARIRLLAHERAIESVEAHGERLLLMRGGEPVTLDGRLPRLRAGDATGRLAEILRHLGRVAAAGAAPGTAAAPTGRAVFRWDRPPSGA